MVGDAPHEQEVVERILIPVQAMCTVIIAREIVALAAVAFGRDFQFTEFLIGATPRRNRTGHDIYFFLGPVSFTGFNVLGWTLTGRFVV